MIFHRTQICFNFSIWFSSQPAMWNCGSRAFGIGAPGIGSSCDVGASLNLLAPPLHPSLHLLFGQLSANVVPNSRNCDAKYSCIILILTGRLCLFEDSKPANYPIDVVNRHLVLYRCSLLSQKHVPPRGLPMY